MENGGGGGSGTAAGLQLGDNLGGSLTQAFRKCCRLGRSGGINTHLEDDPAQAREEMQNDVLGGGRSSGFSPTVTIVSSDGRYALTAAEMASIEALKTREKLKTKADHVRMSRRNENQCRRHN